MHPILDFEKLNKAIDQKWSAIKNTSNEQDRYWRIVEYLKFLMEQYEKGSLGYMLYPYFVTSLLSIDGDKHTDLGPIINLATELEIPNLEGNPTNPRTRLDITEKLSNMIKSL